MPSEAQCQEPRDRGPPPPVTRAGRSAQLAKAAATNSATSSTPERRPRGRPRKDGSSSRPTPPAPAATPPPPSPKSRKKGRSRGRAQVEDEESMDATEKNPPQNTEVKEERRTGRRRSTSRKKVQTDPDPNLDPQPGQDRLCPQPELDSVAPPHEANAKPAPTSEEGHRGSPAAPLPDYSPGNESEDTPQSPSPFQVHTLKPVSESTEQGRPILSRSPSPKEVYHSVSPVAMEMDEDKVVPVASSLVQQSPAPSPCSSPPVSPYLRLEDDDSFSPLFQRSLSEDSGGSPTPSLGDTKKRLKQCAFCYRGDELPLGQGQLVVFGPTPGYIPLHILSRRASSDRDNDCHAHCYSGDQAQALCSSPEQSESSAEFVEQFGPIGLPHDINVQSLFDPTGQCCAHLQCAAWSEGVCRGEGQSLLYVDKAIDLGCTQVCAFCCRLGASVRCQESGCGQSYHFPCATAAGAFQDFNQRQTWCTRHKHSVCSQCEMCSGGGDNTDLFMCCCCGDRYHGSCLDPPLTPSPFRRAGWQCPHCRACQSCRSQDDKSVLLVCEHCDKAYHTHCLTPPLDHTPSTGWSCKNCRVCRRCGVTSSGQWANHPFLCKSCDPALPCPLCDHPPDLYTPLEYLTCTHCYRCVHTKCIVQTGEGRAVSEGYICSTCKPQDEELIQPTQILHCLIEPLSPRQAPPISISQLQLTNHSQTPPVSPTAHRPVNLFPSDPSESPCITFCTLSEHCHTSTYPDPTMTQQGHVPSNPYSTDFQEASSHPVLVVLHQSPVLSLSGPTELQESPVLSHLDPTKFQQKHIPTHLDPTELQPISAQCPVEAIHFQQSPVKTCPNSNLQSPAHTNIIGLQQSTANPNLQKSAASTHPEPSEQQESAAPPHPDPSDLQQCTAETNPDPSDLQESPALTHPDPSDLQQSAAPTHPDPSELQESTALSHPDPSDLQQCPAQSHPESSELQESAEPTHPDPSDLQQSAASTNSEPSELQESPAPSHPDPSDLQQCPAQSHPESSEVQESPEPTHPDPSDLQQSAASTNSEPLELQESPAPSHPDPSELQESPALSHPNPSDLQQSPAPPHPELSDLQQSPAQSHPDPPDPSDLQQGPAQSHPELSDLQHSPAQSRPDPSDLQHSPAQSHPDPSDLQQSPAPSPPHPSDLQQSPAPSPPHPSDLQQSPAPSPPHPSDLQQSPAPSPPHPSDLQQSPAPTHPDSSELQESPALSPPDPSDLQQSPAPSRPDPSDLQKSPAPAHPDSSEIQESPALAHPDPSEIQESPAPAHPDPSEIQESPAPAHPDSSDLQESPELSPPDPSDLQQSPAPAHPDPSDLQESPAPAHPDPSKIQESPPPAHPDSSDLQESPPPAHPDSSDLQESPAPAHPDPSDLQQSPALSHSEPLDLQESLAPSHPGPSDLEESLAPAHPDPSELQQSPALFHSEPLDLQESLAPSHPGPSELQQSPVPSPPYPSQLHQSHSPSEIQQSSMPTCLHSSDVQQGPALFHPDVFELQQSSAPTCLDSRELQPSPAPSHLNLSDLKQSSSPSNLDLLKLQQSSSELQFDPLELKDSTPSSPSGPTEPKQMPKSPHCNSPSSPTPNSTVKQLQQSPVQGRSMFSSSAHSASCSPSVLQPGNAEPNHSPPSICPAQNIRSHLNRPCSSTNIISHPQTGQYSSVLHGHTHISTSLLWSSAKDDDSTLDKDKSKHSSQRPISAPCSPSSSPLGPNQHSLSQPASPVHAHSKQPARHLHHNLLPLQLDIQSRVTDEFMKICATEMNFLDDHLVQTKTLDNTINSCNSSSNLVTSESQLPNQFIPVQCSTHSPDHASPTHVCHTTPESLAHVSTSAEHSSLSCSPCTDEKEGSCFVASHIPSCLSSGSPSHCPEAVKDQTVLIKANTTSVSSTYTREMPPNQTSFFQACASPIAVETGLAHGSTIAADTRPSSQQASYFSHSDNPLASSVSSPVQPAGSLAVPVSCQDNDIESTAEPPSLSIKSDSSPRHSTAVPGTSVHSTPTHVGLVDREANSACAVMDLDAVENSSSCSYVDLAQTQSNQSPTHLLQSSPSRTQTNCSPSPTSFQPIETSFSPPHCIPTETIPAGTSVSQSLSNITSDYSGQTVNCSAIADVNVIQSPPRFSPAGQANQSSSAPSGLVQRHLISLANTSHSSSSHASFACSKAQASKTYNSPSSSSQENTIPAADTGTTSGLDVALRLDVDSSLIQSKLHLDTVLLKPSENIRPTSPSTATAPAISHNKASLNLGMQSLANPQTSSHQTSALVSPLDQRPATEASSSQARPGYFSPAQGNSAMPSTSHTGETPASPTPSSSLHLSPPHIFTTYPSHTSCGHSGPAAGLACGSIVTETLPNPGHSSSVLQEVILSTSPSNHVSCKGSAGLDAVCPALANPVHRKNNPSPVPASPVSSHAAPEVPQQNKQSEEDSAACLDICLSEVKEEGHRKTEKEEMERKAQQPEPAEEPYQTAEVKMQPVERAEKEEIQQYHLPLPHTTVASSLILESQSLSPQPIKTHFALPLHYNSSYPSSPSPPSPHGTAPLEVSPNVSPHRTALPHSCSPHTPQEDQHEERESKDQTEVSVLLEDSDNQPQSLFEPVATATVPTRDNGQSQAEPSERRKVEEDQEEKEGVTGCVYEEKVEEQSDMEEELVTPVLDLDPSLDMEVMDLMTSSHLSSLSPPPASCRGKGHNLRPPTYFSRPSDDLSIRLRQSPFSTEASPETSPTRVSITPPPLSPLSSLFRCSPPARESLVPPTTVLPLTPKIGMGKPAITKRKFSPGRARVKQGSWWSNRRAVSPPSSSQDSMGEGGWDSPKPRPSDSPLWSMRVGRGSGFPGRRRSRGGGVGGARGGGRGRSRLKTQDSLSVSPGGGYVELLQPKEEEENSMHNTVVMFSTSDHFTLRQDMCVVCGSFGQGAEGRLLACSQCGQCYHPYCVNVKITRVVLTKGWRCLECTVCEACGEASDPGRLLLCDDCDISYHTYCLDPPLHTVPKGAWKCKWCVWCVQCGSTSPGLHCDWQSNYSRCGPCVSLSCCPLCQRRYLQDDLILQCQQCDRWVHAVCQGLTTEDEVEVAADEGFDCSLCKTQGQGSYGTSNSFDSPYMAQIISRIREPDTKTYTQDGVCLTESGLSHLQALVEPLTSPRRVPCSICRCKPKLKLRIINQNSVSVLQTPSDLDPPTEQDHSRGDLECEIKSDSSPERDHAEDDVTKEPDVTDGNKKRKRKPYRPGIGGFMVRQRGAKAGPGRIKLCRKDLTEMLLGRDEGLLDADMETAPPADQTMEKAKKRYRKKKTKLEEEFPSYLQEAFFGRDLLDRSRQVDKVSRPEMSVASHSAAVSMDVKVSIPGFHVPSPPSLQIGNIAANSSKKHRALSLCEDTLVDLSDVLNTDPHILATGPTGQFQVERSPSPFAGLDISSIGGEPSLTSDPTGSGGQAHRVVHEEPLDVILSPELDKMVTDGAILSKLYKIPELEGKDVEEVFTAVLSPNSSNNQQLEQCQHPHSAAGNKMHPQPAAGVYPRLPLMNGLMGATPHFPHVPVVPSSGQGPAGLRMPPPQGPPQDRGPNIQTPAGEGEQDAMSTAQRGMLKWEREETLGELATVAPVLYCNTNFPQLKEQYPDWSTRVKQITKLWRKASSQDRAPYVQKARDNRAAQRINKVQLNEPFKRQPPPQHQLPPLPPPPPPPPGQYDPVSMETEVAFRDPLRPRESEQEQEWKLRQQMRQKSKQLAKMEATQKLEQVKKEQRQQQLLAGHRLPGTVSPEPGSHSPMTPTQQLITGDSSSPLSQSRQQGSSGLTDVFLRPQAPPPSGFPSLPHSPHPSSPLHQPPTSPQMFSPPSSRPSSPWDPYSKVAGTPRPNTQSGSSQQQHRNSLGTSPPHDAFGSPALSPDSKSSDVRVLGPQPGLHVSRAGMISPPSSSAPDLTTRQGGIRADAYQKTSPSASNLRTPVPAELVQGGVFKAPMPPQHQPQQDVFASTGGVNRRDPSRLSELGFALPQSQDFPSSPLSGLGSPHRSPYAQAPGTPRPDYSQHIADPFSQQSPLASRPSPDSYTNPHTPGTPHPHSEPTYLPTPPALRLDQYNQQSTNRRPSPSHPTFDVYASSPGTPRPFVTERFPRSPGSQRSTEPYAQPVGTPRPTLDPYTQQPSTPRPQKTPGETFTPQAAASGSSLAPGLSVETAAFAGTSHQSPGRQQQDLFPRTPSNQTPKHPGMSEECGLSGQTLSHDSIESGHMTPGHSQTDKTASPEMAALATVALDGMLPQIGDSDEKLRQRQRLRQLILRQQQQKSALRQEIGLHEPAAGTSVPTAGPSSGSGTPRHWSQEDSSTAPSSDLFGRPPPPYPGIVKPGGATVLPAPRFSRGFAPSEAPFPRQNLPRELGLRGLAPRFSASPGTPAASQDSFLHPPQASVPGPSLSTVEGAPVHMRRSGEFTSIRPLTAPNTHPNLMPGAPQHVLPRSFPIQQHSIMGQPYIELRHRAPDARMRLPFPLPASLDTGMQQLGPRDSQTSLVRPSQGSRLGEPPLGQQMLMTGGIMQLNQQHLGQTVALTQGGETALPGPDGIEEHLDGEDSAVKDLEDVEVKDLVDLNLNLDPEDGKEDLDLGASDLHLDDFLLSGKFDLIAYADPELNLEDSEDLDLGDSVEEKAGGEKQDGAKKTDSRPPVPTGVEVAESSALHTKDKVEESGAGALPALQTQEHILSSVMSPRVHPPVATGPEPIFHQPQQRIFGSSPSPLLTSLPQGPSVSPHPMSLPPAQPHMHLNPQVKPPNPGSSSQTQDQAVFLQNQNKSRPLLVEEQPLLLQDLLDQERQEQQQQKQMQALIRQRSTDSVFPNMADFDSISDPIMKAKMVALKGINKVMTQSNMGLNPMVINRLQPAPGAATGPVAPPSERIPQPPHPVGQDKKLNPQLVRPSPPSFAPGFVNESERRQYEEWLAETQQLLQMQQRLLEDQITAHRKTKKALSAKQRTAKKAGRAFADEDAAQLRCITEQQGAVQKQLEQIRKQQKDHAELIEEYRAKHQEPRALVQQQPAAPPIMTAGAPAVPGSLLPQPLVPMLPRQGDPSAIHIPNVSPGWTTGSGAPGVIGQRMPPQIAPALPNSPQAPTQTPPAMVTGLTTPKAGFTAEPRGPNGAAVEGAPAIPQVKFDDNNPFSEGFQERERRERLREQQERQRVQLMQEVERHRALQQRLELEQQGVVGNVPGSQGSGLATSSELERQLSVTAAAQQRASALAMEFQRGPLTAARLEVKLEREEVGACGGGVVKMEEGGRERLLSPSSGDAGKELLRHLLKDKASLSNMLSPTAQSPLIACRQPSSDSIRSEEEDHPGPHGNMVLTDNPGLDLPDLSGKKSQRCKRLARPEKDRAPPKYKRRKKEEDKTTPSSDQLVTHLTQLSVLPLMEPVLGLDLSLFTPYGGSFLGRDSRLTGSFGNACLDGVSDYYSQLIYKQNNLSNPPTPPASLPPTPPPVARQKLVNGFAMTEELAPKELPEQDEASGLKQKGSEILDLKSVDVPASLPTPPHNIQEEHRLKDLLGRDSPDGFIPSSSPESVADMELSRYPDLSFIKVERPSPCSSPTIPMMPCSLGKGSAVKQEVKVEPTLQGPPSCSNTDLVTIAITLNPVAAQNVAGVMAAITQLLRVSGRVNYQLSRPPVPEQSSLALLAGVRVPLMQSSAGIRQLRPPPALGNTGVRMNYIQAARPQCCSYCKALLGNGVRIVRELKQETQSRPGSNLVFCSPNCSALYTSKVQGKLPGNKATIPVLMSGSDRPPPTRVQHQYSNNMSSIAVHSLPLTQSSVPPTASSSPQPTFPPASAIAIESKPRTDSLKVKVKLKPHPRAVPGDESARPGKRIKNSRWRRWSISVTLSRGPCIPNEAVAMPTEEEMDLLLKKLGACLHPDPLPKDQRRCCFCHQQGDGQTDGPARLLNLDLDLWVHLNCALWSSEVYETQAGALINVEPALRRGLTLRCAYCQQIGATSGCNRLRCTNTYHFTCALHAHCTFFKDKTMLCHLHKPRTVPLSGDRSSNGSPSSTPGPIPDPAAVMASDPYDSELRCFTVFRRVYVQRDEARQIAAVVQRGERQHTFRVGSLLFRAIGRLLPHQMNSFHNKVAIFPIGYNANRFYWSMRYNNRRCKYMCYIEEKEGEPLFKVKVVEKGHEDLVLTGPTPKAVWDQILEPLSQMRASSGALKLFPVYLKGEDLFGLTTSAVTRILESLPGVEACERYTFRYGRNPLMEWPLAFNPSGSARTEPKACQAKRPYLLTSVAPRCQGSVGSIVGLVPGVLSLSPGESVAGAHQGRHSKSSQYRRMKAEWKSNVYLARSRIQGLGLYAARDIEKCTMVIEYIGTIIRSEVANRKERLYESQNRGVYMFRIDNDYVIDATITGGPARYINHSCAPNCITEVVTVEKENKIIISSCRRIQRGEELCYDYKFDLEDDQHKIPCHCGAVNCRKWMN
ncbi:LOW QUALITY PROTEIN: histone-lysine N-methyltransferase 2C-like [Betta splendens]|uniref:Histone-lysine N-methyltransferase 2C n=1 Tax=Betta splendens TaxID=158456 RepID=A0A9W2XPY1_BETSP|nr:LOW QUALITY PROTEIN: histone-lysine N-methyltransferase 2C-like [Betta splendens]